MRLLILACVLLVGVNLVAALPENWATSYNRYEGYRVYEVTPESREQVDLLRKWMLEEIHFDFWTEPSKDLKAVQIMVNAKQASRLTTKCRKHGLKFSVHINNLSEKIEKFVQKETKRRSDKKKVFDINKFNELEDIMAWLEVDLLNKCEANNITYTIDISGTSVEGRPIPVVTMSKFGTSNKPVYLFDATIHAREWIATATISKIMDHVCAGSGGTLVNENTMRFIPVVNPDGYAYSWDTERYWRKNRQPLGDCTGVDLNRNADYLWGSEGVSNDPCSDIYCGPSGNSEPEMLFLDSILNAEYPSKRAYVTFHSFGNMWLHSWGNTVNHAGIECQFADDHEELLRVADATANNIGRQHGTTWRRGNACDVLYRTTGATVDYAKAEHGWVYSYTGELRGDDFVIPESQIHDSFTEVWAGLEAKEISIP